VASVGKAEIARGELQELSGSERVGARADGSAKRSASTHLIELPPHRDARGSLTSLEEGEPVPFEIRRVFYIFDVAEDATRAAHAAADVDEVVIAVSGSFTVVTVEHSKRTEFRLERPTEGLFIPGLAWRELCGFSEGSVCLVLASTRYDPSVQRSADVEPAPPRQD
jgi:hypothetical protein